MIKETSTSKPLALNKQFRDYHSVFCHKDTWTNACTTVGSVLSLIESSA